MCDDLHNLNLLNEKQKQKQIKIICFFMFYNDFLYFEYKLTANLENKFRFQDATTALTNDAF